MAREKETVPVREKPAPITFGVTERSVGGWERFWPMVKLAGFGLG